MLSRARELIWPAGKPSKEVQAAAQQLINQANLLDALTEDMRRSREENKELRDG